MQLISVHLDPQASQFQTMWAAYYARSHSDSFLAVVGVSGGDVPRAHMTLRQGERWWVVLCVESSWRISPDQRYVLLRPYKKTDGVPELGRLMIAKGCCVDRPYGTGCSDATCMNLPDGKTCADCIHVTTCVRNFGHHAHWVHCQWYPRRFLERDGE
jgi:hypothetical protein